MTKATEELCTGAASMESHLSFLWYNACVILPFKHDFPFHLQTYFGKQKTQNKTMQYNLLEILIAVMINSSPVRKGCKQS